MTLQRAPGLIHRIGSLFAWAVSLFAASWRVEGVDHLRLELDRCRGTPLLLGFWHGKYLPLLPLLRGIPASIFIGESLRGSLIESICRAFGFSPVLLPHGDRPRALACMRAALMGPLLCATPFDGPLGPSRRVKPALLELATECGATILPVSMSGTPCAVLRWRWDQREIPWPFARVVIHVGAPIQVPVGLGRAQQGEWCERARAALDALGAEAPMPHSRATG